MGTTPDFRVADLDAAEAGRREIELAEHEMPGLMAMRAELGAVKALQGRGPARALVWPA